MICIKIIIEICTHQCSIASSKEITNLSIHSQVRGAETTEDGVFNQSIHLLQKNLKRNRKMTRISADSCEIIAKKQKEAEEVSSDLTLSLNESKIIAAHRNLID